jgi:hypothetical protein
MRHSFFNRRESVEHRCSFLLHEALGVTIFQNYTMYILSASDIRPPDVLISNNNLHHNHLIASAVTANRNYGGLTPSCGLL